MHRFYSKNIKRLTFVLCMSSLLLTYYMMGEKGQNGRYSICQYLRPDYLGDEIEEPSDWLQVSRSKQGTVVVFENDLDLWSGFSLHHKNTFTQDDLLVLHGDLQTHKLKVLKKKLQSRPVQDKKPLDELPPDKNLKYLHDCRLVYKAQKILHLVFTDVDFSPLGDSVELASRLKCYINILETVARSRNRPDLVLHVLTANTRHLRIYDTYPSPLLKGVLMYGYVYKNIYHIPVTIATHSLDTV